MGGSSASNSGVKFSRNNMSSNMSVNKGLSSNGTQTSPATGAKCVRSSGSSFNTETIKTIRLILRLISLGPYIQIGPASNIFDNFFMDITST